MYRTIAVLPGDGVGPEVIQESIRVLQAIEKKYNHTFTLKEGLVGGVAIDKLGDPYPTETHELCTVSDAILFGAIGDPKYDNDTKAKIRPEQGLLKMRKDLSLYANVRPIKVFDALIDRSPIRPELVKGVDFVVIRELTGGIYFGEPRGRSENGQKAFDTSEYTTDEIIRIAQFAFKLAMERRKHVTVVDKANVLATSRLWRETVQKYAQQYPDVTCEYMFVDNAAMQIIRKPSSFDVILTENMFGDILTDEASVLTGSIGMLPSASIGEKTSLYEPIHGSYPKATGKKSANPIGTILSVALMLEYSFGMIKESRAVVNAVKQAVNEGHGTKDIIPDNPMDTHKLGETIASFI